MREQLPPCPSEIVLNVALIHYVATEDDEGELVAMDLCFTPAQQIAPGQHVIAPPRVRIKFDGGGWETFKRQVERDGEASDIAIARVVPARGPGSNGDLVG